MDAEDQVVVEISGGPRLSVPWQRGMTIRDALEAAYNQQADRETFTYGLQYYGSALGHLVMMINENYDSFDTSYQPDFFWRMSINARPAEEGVDRATLGAGDTVTFTYSMRTAADEDPLAEAKYGVRTRRRS